MSCGMLALGKNPSLKTGAPICVSRPTTSASLAVS